ncbi:hypothetical protein FDB28_16080 [Clostridium botulinum]|nr:hypothetical protein [Clostridium botulinum]NFS97429.1 hypothetical protein [Clostridium botulinum]
MVKKFNIEDSKKEIKSFYISYSVNYEELMADLYENRKEIIEFLKMLRYVINFHKKGIVRGLFSKIKEKNRLFYIIYMVE